MKREISINKIKDHELWDIIIVGGGATGLGAAVDAASRGYKTLLLEQADFAKGTSSRSTKLVHGGVRYLQQGNAKLVMEALRERGLFLKNAPHIARKQVFVIPIYSQWEKMKYYAGLKLYDWMSGKENIGHSRWLNKEQVFEKMPGVKEEKLKGGILYYDGQFDDARMAIALAQTCEDLGGTLLNYFKVEAFEKDQEGKITGLKAEDMETGTLYALKTKVVINATGVFVDGIHQLDSKQKEDTVRPSQGVHLVLPPKFLQTDQTAMMIPTTDDGRVLFLVPWHGALIVGTTDTPLEEHTLEPRALEKEIDFILRNASTYLKSAPQREDVLSVFAGLRPLALPTHSSGKASKDISRRHSIQVSTSGLITVTGGKWTTYRQMGEDAIDKAIVTGSLPEKACETKSLKIHGWASAGIGEWDPLGSDRRVIQNYLKIHPQWVAPLDDHWNLTKAEVIWSVKEEMARTVEDILCRRYRIVFLDARAAIRMAPKVAAIIKEELNKGDEWEKRQLEQFNALANGYLLS